MYSLNLEIDRFLLILIDCLGILGREGKKNRRRG
jgi:hypothetical protein